MRIYDSFMTDEHDRLCLCLVNCKKFKEDIFQQITAVVSLWAKQKWAIIFKWRTLVEMRYEYNAEIFN